MHVTIIQDREVVVNLPDWKGPIPSKGDYLFHPPTLENGSSQVGRGPIPDGTAGCVKTVTWRMHDRYEVDGDEVFMQSYHPYVEITI